MSSLASVVQPLMTSAEKSTALSLVLRCASVVCALWLVLWLSCPEALALQKNAYRNEGYAYFRAGKRLEQQGKPIKAVLKYMFALGLFAQAEKLLASAHARQELRVIRHGLSCVIGHTYLRARRWRQAYYALRQCQQGIDAEEKLLATSATGRKAPSLSTRSKSLKPQLQQARKQANAGLRKLKPHYAGRLAISSEPAGAQLELTNAWGQQTKGTTPFSQTLFPGRYLAHVTSPGARTVSFAVVLKPGQTVRRTITLTVDYARVSLQTLPRGAQVTYWKDGQKQPARTTPCVLQLPPGVYRLHFFLPTYQRTSIVVRLRPGERMKRVVDMPKKARETAAEKAARLQRSYQAALQRYRKRRSNALIFSIAGILTGLGGGAVASYGAVFDGFVSDDCTTLCSRLVGGGLMMLSGALFGFGVSSAVRYGRMKSPTPPASAKQKKATATPKKAHHSSWPSEKGARSPVFSFSTH